MKHTLLRATAAGCVSAVCAAALGGCAGAAGPQPGIGRHQAGAVELSTVGPGWAANSVNAVVFRKNALASDGVDQYIAYYDGDGVVTLGKRKLAGGPWHVQRTPYQGNARDAHNTISIMVDGAGYLHLAWDHHNNALHYARSVAPGSLAMRAAPMTGRDEGSLSYPEFFRLADGGLLFFYRDGGSGRGNLVLNRYDPTTMAWTRLHANLIDGEGRRNAYWQACVDGAGTVHVSWVWRESPDVASNHDMAYARSRDGGLTWEDSSGKPYALPINAAGAEYAARIPQGSELINQTSMAADARGRPYIASYWREPGSAVPQYRVLYKTADGGAWRRLDLDFRRTPFSLSGAGTKAIPVSRPQLLVRARGAGDASRAGAPVGALLVFRDRERGDGVSAVRIDDVAAGRWRVEDLDTAPLGAWEPSFDTELWRRDGVLDLFLQAVRQVDGEGVANAAPTPVRVLRWRPGF